MNAQPHKDVRHVGGELFVTGLELFYEFIELSSIIE